MNEENKVLTPNETPETTVEDTKGTAPEQVADDKKDNKGKKNKPKKKKGSFKAFLK